MSQPSTWALEKARESIFVNESEPVEVHCFGKVFVYTKTADALKAADQMVVLFAQALDDFHSQMLVFSVWTPKAGDES